jgi:PilZ domain-containing protein
MKDTTRRSDRVSIELPIEVSGTDATGRMFLQAGKTVLINRHGAKILLPKVLVPDQEVSLRCKETKLEADGRIVGQIGEGPGGFFYGISFLNSESNPWGIEFPEMSAGADAVGRILLECVACHVREVAYLDDFELEVLEANQVISRSCKRCTDVSMWKKSFAEIPAEETVAAQEKKQEQRREPRRDMRVQACVRSFEFNEEVVMTQNISRSGLCFASRRPYRKGWDIEVAVPYSKGGGNIFMKAKIARIQEVKSEDITLYGAFYVRPS